MGFLPKNVLKREIDFQSLYDGGDFRQTGNLCELPTRQLLASRPGGVTILFHDDSNDPRRTSYLQRIRILVTQRAQRILVGFRPTVGIVEIRPRDEGGDPAQRCKATV